MALPKINIGRIQSGVGSRTPSSPGSEGGRALESLGNQVGNLGREVMQMAKRREAEEARDLVANFKASDRLNSAAEFESMKEEFRDNPKGFADNLLKTQDRRRVQSLKGIDNPLAQEEIKRIASISQLENRLVAQSFERTQTTANSMRNILTNAEVKATADFEKPPAIAEFMLDLEEDRFDINQRDLSGEQKDSLLEKNLNTRLNGVVNGYMRGGSFADFKRARDVVDQVSPMMDADKATKMFRRIDQEENRQRNLSAARENSSRKAVSKQFEQERGQIRDVLSKATLGEDVSDDLKRLKIFGKIDTANFAILNESNMSSDQQSKSESLRMAFYDQISSTNKKDVFTLRADFNRLVTTGQISSEDGTALLNSIEAKENSKYGRAQHKQSNAELRAASSNNFMFAKAAEKQKFNRMTALRDDLVHNDGFDYITAGRVAMKEEGMHLEIETDRERLNTRLQNFRKNVKEGKITPVKAKLMMKKLKKDREMLGKFDNIPSLSEIRGAK